MIKSPSVNELDKTPSPLCSHICPLCGKKWESDIEYELVWCESCRTNLRRYWKPKDF